MFTMDNKIDLIITVYNKEEYIIRAINSGISQYKYKFNKIFVVNDGSTDNSKMVIEEFIKNRPEIELINIKNSGVSFARNIATKNSKAKYVCYLDGDDELSKFYLFEINNLIRLHSDCKIFSTIHKNIFSSEDLVITNNFNQRRDHVSSNPIKNFIFNFRIICSSGICILKQEIEKFPFPENIKIGEDIYVWLKLFSVNKLAWSSLELILIHKNSKNRVQNIFFNEIPYYLKKKDEIKKNYNFKFWINLYFFLSYFINYLRIKNENKSLIKNFQLLNKNYKINSLIVRYLPFLLLNFVYWFFSNIRKKNKNIILFFSSFFTPSTPVLFLLAYIFNDKILAFSLLKIHYFLNFLFFSFSLYGRSRLSYQFSINFFIKSFLFRLLILPLIYLLSYTANFYLKVSVDIFFYYIFYAFFLWMLELYVIFLIFKKRYNYIFLLLFLLIPVLAASIFLLIEKIEYSYLLSLSLLLIIILLNYKLFRFIKIKFLISKKKLFLNLNLIKLNLFSSINNFLFRFVLLELLAYAVVTDYFFILFLLTIPISFYNSYACDVVSVSSKKMFFLIIMSLIFYFVFTFFYFFYFSNLINFQIYFLHLISCLLLLFINFTRYKMINDPVKISDFMYLDLASSICFLTLLVLSFSSKTFLLYIFCINTILQLFIYRNYVLLNFQKIIFRSK